MVDNAVGVFGRANVDRDADAAARVLRQARDELTVAVAVADVEADRHVAHVLHGAAALDFTRDRTALDFHRLAAGADAALLAIDLVADQAADDGARGGAAIASPAAPSELVADHAAGDRADDRARAHGRAVVLAR